MIESSPATLSSPVTATDPKTMSAPHSRTGLWDRLTVALATGLGTGRLPWFPGTWGSVLGVGIYAALAVAGIPLEAIALLAIVAFVVGIPLCTKAAQVLGAGEDPGVIVYDEIVGMMFTLLFVPLNWQSALVGFCLFRLFDTRKPWPVHRFEALHGGLGIMADDFAAGLAAGGALWAARWALLSSMAG